MQLLQTVLFTNLLVFSLGIFSLFGTVFAQSGVFPADEEVSSLLMPAESDLLGREMVDFPSLAGVQVVIKPQKPIFRLGEDIVLLLEIKNLSPTHEDFRFEINENNFLQMNAYVVDKEGQSPFTTAYYETAQYLLENEDMGNNFPLIESSTRNITLSHQQSFTTTIKLNDYYDFEKNDTYYVKINFYPLQKMNMNYFLESNEMQFQISGIRTGGVIEIDQQPKLPNKTAFIVDSYRNKNSVTAVNAQAYGMLLDPQSVVEKSIADQQKKNWVEFLQSFNLRRLLQNSYASTDYAERYAGALEREKPVVVDDFSQFLVDSIDYEVRGFETLKTTVIGNKAKVEVLLSSVEPYVSELEFFNAVTGQIENEWIDLQGDVLERERRFIYDLQKIDGEWKIISIDTRVVDGIAQEEPTFEEEKPVKALQNIERLGFIYFDNNASELRLEFFSVLDALIDLLEEDNMLRPLLIGYADERGSEEYNLNLSAARVNSVRAYLTERGIARERIDLDARGEIKLSEGEGSVAVPNEEQLRKNRRVEIYISR